MVDFKELKDKAQDLVSEHADSIKSGIEKVGSVVGDKIGHDKADKVEGTLSSLVDKAAGRDQAGDSTIVAPAGSVTNPLADTTTVAPAGSFNDPVAGADPTVDPVPDPAPPVVPPAPRVVPPGARTQGSAAG